MTEVGERQSVPSGEIHPAWRALGRRRLVVLGVVAAVLLSSGIGTVWFFGRGPDTTKPITVSDARQVVAIDLPAGWIESTAKDAGRISTEDDSGDTVPAYRVPDIVAYRPLAGDRSQAASYLEVLIDVPPVTTLQREHHLAHVRRLLADAENVTFTAPESIEANGHPALRSSGKDADDGSDLFVITVLSPEYVVTFIGDTTLYREPGWDSLPTDPRREELARLVSQARIA